MAVFGTGCHVTIENIVDRKKLVIVLVLMFMYIFTLSIIISLELSTYWLYFISLTDERKKKVGK